MAGFDWGSLLSGLIRAKLGQTPVGQKLNRVGSVLQGLQNISQANQQASQPRMIPSGGVGTEIPQYDTPGTMSSQTPPPQYDVPTSNALYTPPKKTFGLEDLFKVFMSLRGV